MKGAIGQVIYVRLAGRTPPGHEQEGTRPCVVVGDPSNVGRQRFRVFLVAPLTTSRGQSWQANSPTLYPVLPSGTAGLAVDSVVLLDQTQTTDSARVASLIGTLTVDEYEVIAGGLRKLCNL